MSIDLEALQAFPKVSLHDHLDGALRPQTIIELAAEIGHPLPADNADDLGRWFARAADSGSLVQLPGDLRSNASRSCRRRQICAGSPREYRGGSRRRWSHLRRGALGPEQHLQAGLTKAEAIEAVREGLADGMASLPGSAVTRSRYVSCLPAMRQAEPTPDIARAGAALSPRRGRGLRYRRAREGFPPARFLEIVPAAAPAERVLHHSCRRGRRLSSPIWEAVQVCGANRIGHGVAIIADIRQDERGASVLGRASRRTFSISRSRSRCVRSSNVQTGAVAVDQPSIRSIAWTASASALRSTPTTG